MENVVKANEAFWRGRKVLLTGHTGFKGAWLAFWLSRMGASVTALSLPPSQSPSLWSEFGNEIPIDSVIGDIRDKKILAKLLRDSPDIVFHLAAQALVGEGYRDPAETFSVNVMGTITLLEALREHGKIACVLVATSDKVYRERLDGIGSQENDCLGGSDPYSASKAAQEMACITYAKGYFEPLGIPLVTGRAGNVIGGGDWSKQRLIPDIWRAVESGATLELRYPNATRPWQHVLDCLNGYLCYVEQAVKRSRDKNEIRWPRHLNFAPGLVREQTVAEVVAAIGEAMGLQSSWKQAAGPYPSENPRLVIDASLARRELGWQPRLDQAQTLRWTAEWYSRYSKGEKAGTLCAEQINRFEAASL